MAEQNTEGETLVKEITKLSEGNVALIQKIKNRKTVTIIKYEYNAIPLDAGLHKYTAREIMSEQRADTYLNRWKFDSRLTPVEDIFNDALNFNISTLEEVEKLNTDMVPVVKKFVMFNSSPQSLVHLKTYKANFEKLNIQLKALNRRMVRNPSHISEINRDLAEINTRIANILLKYDVSAANYTPIISSGPTRKKPEDTKYLDDEDSDCLESESSCSEDG